MGKMQVILVFLVLALCGNCFTEDETELSNQVEEDVSCSQYCDGMYPEHTYPDPEDHSACSRGCRLAVMDALIAWPFSPTSSSCLATCEEAYYDSDHQCYACKVGCNATTIDQRVPNRDHIYQTMTNTTITGDDVANEISFVMEVFEVFRSQLPQFVLITDDISELTDHADKMYQLLPCHSSSSTFIFLDDEGDVVEIQYGYSDSPGESVDGFYNEEDNEGMSSYYLSSCPWQYSTTGRVVFFIVSVTLIAVAILSVCCFAGFMPAETEQPKKVSVELSSGHLKNPVIFTPGYPQPVPYYADKKNTHF